MGAGRCRCGGLFYRSSRACGRKSPSPAYSVTDVRDGGPARVGIDVARNKRRARRDFDDILNRYDVSQASTLLAPDGVFRNPARGGTRPRAVRSGRSERAAGRRFVIGGRQDDLAEHDRLAVGSGTGTHRGDCWTPPARPRGVPPESTFISQFLNAGEIRRSSERSAERERFTHRAATFV
jgi:hypothetical protein